MRVTRDPLRYHLCHGAVARQGRTGSLRTTTSSRRTGRPSGPACGIRSRRSTCAASSAAIASSTTTPARRRRSSPTAKAASDAYPDPNDASGKLSVVDIVPDEEAAAAGDAGRDQERQGVRLVPARPHVATLGDAGHRRRMGADREAQSFGSFVTFGSFGSFGPFGSFCDRASCCGCARAAAARSAADHPTS